MLSCSSPWFNAVDPIIYHANYGIILVNSWTFNATILAINSIAHGTGAD